MSQYQDYVNSKKNSSDWEDFKERRKKSNTKWRIAHREKYNECVNNWKKKHPKNKYKTVE